MKMTSVRCISTSSLSVEKEKPNFNNVLRKWEANLKSEGFFFSYIKQKESTHKNVESTLLGVFLFSIF